MNEICNNKTYTICRDYKTIDGRFANYLKETPSTAHSSANNKYTNISQIVAQIKSGRQVFRLNPKPITTETKKMLITPFCNGHAESGSTKHSRNKTRSVHTKLYKVLLTE